MFKNVKEMYEVLKNIQSDYTCIPLQICPGSNDLKTLLIKICLLHCND